MDTDIVTIAKKSDEKFLRKKTAAFDFSKFKKKELDELIRRMRKAMQEANGIGLSANQLGLDFQAFVAQVSEPNGGMKFYAIFNPKLEKAGKDEEAAEEGCLSVPGKYGMVSRSSRITVSGFDKNQKPLKLKTWGLLARVFQHEMDHLNGKLFIDRATEVHNTAASERLQQRGENVKMKNQNEK